MEVKVTMKEIKELAPDITVLKKYASKEEMQKVLIGRFNCDEVRVFENADLYIPNNWYFFEAFCSTWSVWPEGEGWLNDFLIIKDTNDTCMLTLSEEYLKWVLNKIPAENAEERTEYIENAAKTISRVYALIKDKESEANVVSAHTEAWDIMESLKEYNAVQQQSECK